MTLNDKDMDQTDNARILSEITDVYEKICQAFRNSDIDTVLRYFSDSSEMIKISNGTVLRGKQQLLESWTERIGKADGPVIKIENIDLHPIDEKHLWTIADETISISGQTIKAAVSNIFVHTDSGWKILLDHTTYIQTV